MKTKMTFIGLLIGLLTVFAASASAGIVTYDKAIDYSRFINRDRYLDVQIWTDNDEYYEGDQMTISFRSNNDCYVAIYNIDTRGRVNLIFPTDPGDSPRIRGGKIYQLPDRDDNYQFSVQGPAGTEYLEVVASNDPFPIPDWYNGSGIVCNDDPYNFANFINADYFGCDEGCVRAINSTSFGVKEWHDYYFRPVYHPVYPNWDYCGSLYIDYPFGATVYIDGVYWGCAPLFLPRVYFGWHYITIYDRDGYCWEDRYDVVRYKSNILDRNIIRTHPGIRSRYRDVAGRGYLDPVRNGYPNYQSEVRVKETYKDMSKKDIGSVYNKTRVIDNQRPYYRENDRGTKQVYKTRQSTGENRYYTPDKNRAASEWKVERMKNTQQQRQSSTYEGQKTQRNDGGSVDKRSSGNRSNDGGSVDKRSSGNRGNSGGEARERQTAPTGGRGANSGGRGSNSGGEKKRR